jgi:adenosylhomocysteine nucleosidase
MMRAAAAAAVMAAMRAELAPLFRGARGSAGCGAIAALSGKSAHPMSIDGTHVLLAVSGVGARRADEAAKRLFAEWQVSTLLVVGVAGGLQPGLPCGALVVAERLLDDGSALPAPDPRLVARAVRAGARKGTVLSSSRMLCTAEEKSSAAAAIVGPAVVDLESAAFARRADRAGVPCVVVRAVCDTAEEDLPLDFNAFSDGRGGIDRLAIGRTALFRPDVLAQLLDLRRRVGRCAESLALFTERFFVDRAA